LTKPAQYPILYQNLYIKLLFSQKLYLLHCMYMEGLMKNKTKIQVYYKLPEEAVLIRQAVFVEEQGFKE